MTKEDLKSKFEDSFDAHSYASEGGMGPDVTDWRGMWRSFEPAILEYAKRQSIAFADWLKNNTIGYNMKYTTQQLYNQFIEQQNKP